MSDERHRRPPGADDATVEAVGKVSEALEWVERARGRLYDFHQMMGHADALFGELGAIEGILKVDVVAVDFSEDV